jgi:hypothetical protein
MLSFNLFKSKTFWGGVITLGGWLLNQPHIDFSTVVQGLGALTTLVGARDAVAQIAAPAAPSK